MLEVTKPKRKHSVPAYNKGKGLAVKWLHDHSDYEHDYCLIWPFATVRGYGDFQYLGQKHYAHRYMCELVNGPPPSSDYQPAHSCGRGDDACVNPRHLSWKTPEENQQDKRLHGTANAAGRERFKLTEQQVEEIRGLKGRKTHDELASIFGVSRRNIGAILDGRSWGPERKFLCFMPQEDTKIRELHALGYNYTQMGKAMNRLASSVARRAKTMGLKSNYSPIPSPTNQRALDP